MNGKSELIKTETSCGYQYRIFKNTYFGVTKYSLDEFSEYLNDWSNVSTFDTLEEVEEIIEREKTKAARNKWLDDNGVEEIESCLRAWSEYHRAFNEAFEDEGGFIAPKKPDCAIEDLKAKYPAGYAYIQADNNSFSANYAKAGIYKRAKAAILNGEDYKIVMENAEKEWDKHVEDHMWD